MSDALAAYLSALAARDAREQAHTEYVHACKCARSIPCAPLTRPDTRLADRTAAAARKPSPETAAPAADADLRSELASTQRARGELEARVDSLAADLAACRTSEGQHKQRIAQLEKAKTALERRGKDRADELKGKGRFVEEVQDELVALSLQLNMAEQAQQRLQRENEELTRRWMAKMEDEARKMNDDMGWDASK